MSGSSEFFGELLRSIPDAKEEILVDGRSGERSFYQAFVICSP